MAKKKQEHSKSPNITIRLSDGDRELFDEAAALEHFDSLAQWIKVHLRKAATETVQRETKK